jgi:hypothetical protein
VSANWDDLPGQTGLEKLRALIALDRMPGLLGSLGISFVEIEEGRAVFESTQGLHVWPPLTLATSRAASTNASIKTSSPISPHGSIKE